MTDEPHIPADDDVSHWGPIVEQRFNDFRAVHRFIDRNRHRIGLAERYLIRDLGTRVIEDAGGIEALPIGLAASQSPPATAAWAAVLTHAREVMVAEIIRLCPELLPEIPARGHTPNPPNSGPER